MRGRFRILLGAAAGVGKTYRMLQEGRQAAAEGVDVIIGYLEPHDRPETAALAEGLEVVSRRTADHQGVALEEMDTDAVIRRAPELALIDELAHANVPESRHSKRYQDVEARRGTGVIDPAAQQAILDRILVLVTPQPSSQRLLRRAWRSAQRLGADIDVLWVRDPGERLSEDQTVALAALRRLAAILGAHFLEEESGDVIASVRAIVIDRGTTYVYLGTPARRRIEEILHGAFLGRLIEALPGVDIRVAADRARRRELHP